MVTLVTPVYLDFEQLNELRSYGSFLWCNDNFVNIINTQLYGVIDIKIILILHQEYLIAYDVSIKIHQKTVAEK